MNATPVTRSKTTRVLAMAAAGGLAMLSLAGCIKVNADLTIGSDAKGSGTLGFELQKEAANFLGISDLDSFSTQMTTGDLSEQSGGVFQDGSCTPSETADAYVYACTFTNADFTEEGELWTITKSGDVITFHMVNKGTDTAAAMGGASGAADPLAGASLGDLDVSITFPGPIQSLTGKGATKDSDTTASIVSSMTEDLDVTITSAATGAGSSIARILVVVLGLLVLALIVVVAIVLIVRRRKGPEPEAVIATEAVIARRPSSRPRPS